MHGRVTRPTPDTLYCNTEPHNGKNTKNYIHLTVRERLAVINFCQTHACTHAHTRSERETEDTINSCIWQLVESKTTYHNTV